MVQLCAHGKRCCRATWKSKPNSRYKKCDGSKCGKLGCQGCKLEAIHLTSSAIDCQFCARRVCCAACPSVCPNRERGGMPMGTDGLPGLLPFPTIMTEASPTTANQNLHSLAAKMLSKVASIESNQQVMLRSISNIETTQQLLLQTLGLTLALQQQTPGQAQAQGQVLGQFLMQAAQQQQHQQQQLQLQNQVNAGQLAHQAIAGVQAYRSSGGLAADTLNQLQLMHVEGLALTSEQVAAAESVEHVVAAAMHELQQQGNKSDVDGQGDMLAAMGIITDHQNHQQLSTEQQEHVATTPPQQQEQQEQDQVLQNPHQASEQTSLLPPPLPTASPQQDQQEQGEEAHMRSGADPDSDRPDRPAVAVLPTILTSSDLGTEPGAHSVVDVSTMKPIDEQEAVPQS